MALLHTLGSLPAIPLAIWMLARHGRITPRSRAGVAYFIFLLIGRLTVFLAAKQPASHAAAVVTLILIFAGYGVGRSPRPGRTALYIETICPTLTVFLLLVPSVSETLRRVPLDDPFAGGSGSPVLLWALGALAVVLRTGRLMPVLPDWCPPQLRLTLFYPPYQKLPPRIAAFSDFLERQIPAQFPLSPPSPKG